MTDIQREVASLGGPKFSSELNLAASLKQAKGILARHEAVLTLRASLLNDQRLQTDLLEHLDRLSRVAVDVAFESPFDAEIAAELFALASTNAELGALAAEIASRAPQTWWARQLAHDIRSGTPVTPSNMATTTTVTVNLGPDVVVERVTKSERALVPASPVPSTPAVMLAAAITLLPSTAYDVPTNTSSLSPSQTSVAGVQNRNATSYEGESLR